jgi:xylulokinase
MSYYLGIDFGTSGARAIVIDSDRKINSEVSCHFESVEPNQLTATWEATLWKLISQIPAALRSQIWRIAIDGTSSTVLLCDPEGQPLYSPLLYNDARATIEVQRLAAIAPAGHVVLSASSSLAKLLWLSQRPEFSQAHYLMHQADWLAYLLHGKPGISDYHNALKLGYAPLDPRYPSWLEHSDLKHVAPLLPKVVAPGTPVGVVQTRVAENWGLPSNCWICAGTTDSIAAFLASGAVSPGEAVTSLGSTLVLKLLSKTRVEDCRYGIYSHRLGNLWLVGGASNTGGAILRQFFTDAELEDFSGQIKPNQQCPLDYYPLAKPGERFPINDPQLQPRLQPRPDNPVEFLHGLLESLARIEAQGYHLLQEQAATPLVQVYTAGGGAKNSTWSAIRRRYLKVPLGQPQQTEAAYGTALLAAGLSGLF